jgi:hypothetical protein
MSLLQGVLRSKIEEIDKGLNNVRLEGKPRTSIEDKEDSDDDLVNVVRLFILIVDVDRGV